MAKSSRKQANKAASDHAASQAHEIAVKLGNRSEIESAARHLAWASSTESDRLISAFLMLEASKF